MAEPSTTQAILVGIERYADSNAIPDLNGPVNDVYRFCQWLRYRNVPPENISVFASPLDRNTGIVDEITSLINSKPLEATKDIINKALREEARKKKGELVFLVLVGTRLDRPSRRSSIDLCRCDNGGLEEPEFNCPA